MNIRFKQDYKRFAQGKEYRVLPCIIRMIRNHELRYLFWGRLHENHAHGLVGGALSVIMSHYRRKYGLEIAFEKGHIGAGLRLIHPWNITVNDNAVLGKNVTLFKGCTIGAIDNGSKKGNPEIGDNVTLYSNSTLCGNIKIGNNVTIAAGAFVNFDVPDNAIVIGNPGVIHLKK